MNQSANGLKMFVDTIETAMNILKPTYTELCEAILLDDLPRIQSAAERMHRHSMELAPAAKIIENISREMRSHVRRVA